MKTKMLFLLLSFFAFSCLEKEDAPALLPEGTYSGTFSRSSPNTKYEEAKVTLVLKGNTFSGSSDKMYYPAIGSGTYQVKGQQVTFEDGNFWTANFDWTLILTGTFALGTQDGGITLTRQQGDQTDLYRLSRKQE